MNLDEKKIEEQMKRNLEKIPFEIKKIKLVLFIIKKINKLKSLFKV